MSAGLIGLLAGGALGAFNYGLMTRLAERVGKPETKRVLRLVAVIDLIAFPVAGFLIGTFVWTA